MSLATSNAFAVLKASKGKKDSKKKDEKKKSSKDKKVASAADLEKAIFSQPSLNISNWADEDDDDYTMPALPIDWAEVSEHAGVWPAALHAVISHVLLLFSIHQAAAGEAGTGGEDDHEEHEEHEDSEEVRSVQLRWAPQYSRQRGCLASNLGSWH